jgi:hypothetical protein
MYNLQAVNICVKQQQGDAAGSSATVCGMSQGRDDFSWSIVLHGVHFRAFKTLLDCGSA